MSDATESIIKYARLAMSMKVPRALALPIVAATLLPIACSSGGQGSNPANPGGDAMLGPDGEVITEAGTEDSASTEDSDSATVVSNPWRYAAETLPTHQGNVLVAQAPTGLGIAYRDGSTNYVAVWNGSAWVSDALPDMGSFFARALAFATDGTPWLAISTSTGLSIVHKSGSWIQESAGSGYNLDGYDRFALAVGQDGSPYFAAFRDTPSDMRGVYLVRRSGSTWMAELAGTPPASRTVFGVALGVAKNVPHVAWITQDNEVHVATPKTGGGYTDTLVGSGKGTRGLDLAVDRDGRVHLAYEGSTHAFFDGSSWQIEHVIVDQNLQGLTKLAAAPDGSLAMIWGSDAYGIRLATRGPTGGWSVQAVLRSCSSTGFDVAFDDKSKLHVGDNCGPSVDGRVLGRSVPYPAEHFTACTTLAKTLCSKAYTCCGSPTAKDCCLYGGVDGGVERIECSNPQWYCEIAVFRDVCADATEDTAAAAACNAATSEAICATGTPTPGASAPEVCSKFF